MQDSADAATEPEEEGATTTPGTRPRSAWRNLLYLGCSGVFFLLGLVGVLLPVIPATPFLLLTSYFLVRSSPRLNAALLRSRLFGPILVDWQVHGGVSTHVRVQAIVAVVIAVSITVYLARASLPLVVAVVSLAAVGIVVILRLPSARDL